MSYDIAILGDPAHRVSDLTIDNTANNGIYKLVQKTLVLLFTDVDSEYNLGVGTNLPYQTLSNNADTEHIRNVFNIALSAVKDVLLQSTPLDSPGDERIREYKTQVLRDDRDVISVTITVISQAGTQFTVNVPVPELNTEQSDG